MVDCGLKTEKRRGSLERSPGRTGTFYFGPLDRDLVAQCEGISHSNHDRWASIGRLRAIAGHSGGGTRRSWSSCGGARLRLTGVRLTSVPGVDSSRGLAQEHECDMRNPLGVSVRVYSGSSRVRNGGAAIALRRVGAEVLGC